MRLRVIFDELLTEHFEGDSLIERGFEYREYNNGMSQVIGETHEVMLLIGELSTSTVGLVDATQLWD